jgi:Zn-dependent peptidase ImmA (M78 family)
MHGGVSMDIKQVVTQLVKKHGTNDPFKIAEKLGILIVFEPLGSIYGYYSKSHRTKVIHLNENLSGNKLIFTCTHELGHATIHPEANTVFLKKNTLFSTDKLEIEANTFAVELLLPDELLESLSECSISNLFEAKGIPIEYIRFKKYK